MFLKEKLKKKNPKSKTKSLTSKAGWKAETEHSPNVTLHWIGQDALL